MAIIKDALHSTQARGTVGGLTYSTWRGVDTVKRHPRRVKRRVGKQPANMSILGYLSRKYGDMTVEQMEAWDFWAANHPESNRFGGTFIMSAIQAYVKINHTRYRLFFDDSFEPPADDPAATVGMVETEVADNPGEIKLHWALMGTGSALDTNEIQMAGPFMSKGRRSVFSKFKSEKLVAGNVIEGVIAELQEGTYYWFRVRYVSELGMTTNWVYVQGTPKLT